MGLKIFYGSIVRDRPFLLEAKFKFRPQEKMGDNLTELVKVL